MLPPMTLIHFARAAGSALGVGLIASACSSSPSPPQAFVKLVMSPSIGAPGMCVGYASQTTIMQVGTPGMPDSVPAVAPTRVATGASSVVVSCSVHQTGTTTYAVNLAISQGDVNAMIGTSSLIIAGTVDSSQGGTNLSGDVSTSTGGDYHSSTCSITFSTPGAGGEPAGAPVAPGRIWAHLSCDGTQNPNITTQADTPSTCDAEADVIFENCSS
jgi:hypothetical protein